MCRKKIKSKKCYNKNDGSYITMMPSFKAKRKLWEFLLNEQVKGVGIFKTMKTVINYKNLLTTYKQIIKKYILSIIWHYNSGISLGF